MNLVTARTKSSWIVLLLLLNLIVICGVLYVFINLAYPRVGHDYHLAIPSMLDTLLHFRNNGFTIQWYTPSFGGGIPAFPNPNNGQFSILDILPLWMTPWRAIFVSSVIFISLGFLAAYRFFKQVIKLTPQASILGAVFFSANGFMMERIAVGHLGYQPFPLIAVVLLLFLDTSLTPPISGTLLGLTVAILIHQAGYFLIVVFGLSGLIIFPLVRIFRPESFSSKRIAMVLVTGGILGILISASKLTAVYSFMRYFPRLAEDTYFVNPILGILGLVLQLLGTMNLAPLLMITKLNTNLLPFFLIFTTGANYGYWEFDMSMSPVVIGFVLAGLARMAHRRRQYLRLFFSRQNWLASCFFIFFTWLTVEFTLASGLFYPYLRQLPILSSLHVNPRFAAAFLFPIAFIATMIYQSISRDWNDKKSWLAFGLFNILTLLPMSAYLLIKDDLQLRIYDISQSSAIYQSIQAGKPFEVTSIGKTSSNTQALQSGVSNLNLYEPIFGYGLENFHPEVKPGSIWEASNGYFNMTNPAGYVFPDSNNSRPFERIRLQDRANLETFVNYGQPDWKIPVYQQVSDWVSSLSFIITVVFVVAHSIIAIKKRVGSRIKRYEPEPQGAGSINS